MISSIQGIGIDCVDVGRFLEFKNDQSHPFLKKVFHPKELEYCFSYKNPEVHLAGFFALKEAASKALGVKLFPFAEIEVRHDNNGAPEVWHNEKKIDIKVSISHTESVAIAIAAY
jgi:holo-[acyl-carrier protein] synthase